MPSMKDLRVSACIPTMKPEKKIEGNMRHLIKSIAGMSNIEAYASCLNQSAAKNRNNCIDNTKGDIIIMADDDVEFYSGWADILVNALFFNPQFSIVSARPLKEDGTLAPTLGDCGNNEKIGQFQKCIHTEKSQLNVCCSSCIAFWRSSGVRFDENYKAAVWEDFDFCLEMKKQYPDKDIVFANECSVIHRNAMQGRTSADVSFNYDYCREKWGLNF